MMAALFPKSLGRLQYFLRLLIFIAWIAVAMAILVPFVKIGGIAFWLLFAIFTSSAFVRFPCMDIPRLRNVGWSPWLVLLFLLPIGNFVIQVLLLAVPPKSPEIHLPDWLQRNWKWIVPVACLTIFMAMASFAASCVTDMKSSDVYKESLARVESSPAVIAALGTPMKDGFLFTGVISGNESTNKSESSGTANLEIPISGPKGAATVYVSAEKISGQWHFDDLHILKENGEQINVLETNQLPVVKTE